ncbi:MAG: diaminobutyrate acetyltransferase [Mesorhizobium sp.]|uniref:diaminobutyrate acetyltransferase n=1 Tax=Mesorhizobium sp. TaxID=1871066 RepID=UPI000FE95375|nr:diaminobutyrate acetyltransferase [Mesorhizobium sp.]RWP85331.1 MAG: diaminobutyrate acetyltransferase [Mesorhizobium sp.]
MASSRQGRSDGQLERVTFRKPTSNHAAGVGALIALCPQLAPNSLYCDLLLCTHFADTCTVAERAGEVVGWLSAYRPPNEPSTLFMWQIAVHPAVRNTGVGKGLIVSALNRPCCKSVTHIKATIALTNKASNSLFAILARDLGAPIQQVLWFDRDAHFNGLYESEYMISIGPIKLHPRCMERRQRVPSGR